MEIFEVKEMTPEVGYAVRRLLPQLSSSGNLPTDEMIEKIVKSDSSRLLFASEDSKIIGMLTIVIFPIPSGVRAWIEDVVVTKLDEGKVLAES